MECNESMPTNQTPIPKLTASPTLAPRLTETAVPTKSVATNTPIPQPTTTPTLATQTTQPAKTTTPTVRATLRPTTATTQPTAKTGCPQGCQAQLPGCDIKGNISSSGEKIYHVPSGASYKQTVIDPSKGERWFCTEDEAKANGWRKSQQ
jgi:hypothetical protein